ncbi:hypothetical protein H1P_2330012 [Hyella patelloides LEGE 07179]|uniref:Uncharacterized protein n=1 Tax=Hyella patelloides LEGE 07179 TaxID=945734 RepID=A0A563VRJ1_9CYAN|nr:hypothetical protein H1P_2330012 [Hyella patelloides LEGE 07179]
MVRDATGRIPIRGQVNFGGNLAHSAPQIRGLYGGSSFVVTH